MYLPSTADFLRDSLTNPAIDFLVDAVSRACGGGLANQAVLRSISSRVIPHELRR